MNKRNGVERKAEDIQDCQQQKTHKYKMFHNLQYQMNIRHNKQKSIIKNTPKSTFHKSPLLNKSPLKKPATYSSKLRMKQNNSQAYDYELALFGDHIHQGCFLSNKKHGEGIQILDSGVVIVGNWQNGKLNGYALFISPFGGKVHTNYQMGCLHGPAIMEYGNNFQLFTFAIDVAEPIRRRYDDFEGLWTEAVYDRYGKIEKVCRIQKSKDFELPSFIDNQEMIKFYHKTIMKGETNLQKNRLKQLKISNKFQYFGYTNFQDTPEGLGVLYSYNQLYIGNFREGRLEGEGFILFNNGVLYKGQTLKGEIWGTGAIYDSNVDETKFIKVSTDGSRQVLKCEEGCLLNKILFQKGKVSNIQNDKGFKSAINSLCDELTKYYYRLGPASSYLSSQQKPNLSSSRTSSYSQPNTPKISQKTVSQFTVHTSNAQPDKQTLENEKGQNQSHLTAFGEGHASHESLQFSIEEIQQIKQLSMNTVSCVKSWNLNTDKQKKMYPNLMQFEKGKGGVNKNGIFQGKIVANSHVLEKIR